jgi:trehalose 6-phosphate phosphatase
MSVRNEIVAGLHERRSSALIALDFDGTLAPLVPDPAQSRLVAGVRPALDALAAAGVRVAVVTGRDAATVVELSGLGDLPGLDVEGIYGAQRWHDGQLDAVDEPAQLAQLRQRLPQIVEPVAGVWIEDKGLSLVVHARRTDDPAAAIDALRAAVTDLGAQLRLEVHPGRDVLELRLPGYDKGGALTRLIGRYQPTGVLYVGDDVGDLPAFDVVRQLREGGMAAWAGGISSADVPEVAEHADIALDGPDDVALLLSQIAGLST